MAWKIIKKILRSILKFIEWIYDIPYTTWKYIRGIDDEERKSYYREEYILRKK